MSTRDELTDETAVRWLDAVTDNWGRGQPRRIRCRQVHCVDGDVVELSNLNRQTVFSGPDIGRSKVDVVVERLRRPNSDVQVTGTDRKPCVRGQRTAAESAVASGPSCPLPLGTAGRPAPVGVRGRIETKCDFSLHWVRIWHKLATVGAVPTRFAQD